MSDPTTLLIILSGLCWTLVYIEGLRLGWREKTYAVPFWALVFNLAWEMQYTWAGFQYNPAWVQNYISLLWLLLDIGLFYTYLRFGRRYFPDWLSPTWFWVWSLFGLLTAVMVQRLFLSEFGTGPAAAYSAFLQNLLMSVLFIYMLIQRGGSEGQNLVIAIAKWIGTLAATLYIGALGLIPDVQHFVLVIGGLISLFDLIYIGLLITVKKRENSP